MGKSFHRTDTRGRAKAPRWIAVVALGLAAGLAASLAEPAWADKPKRKKFDVTYDLYLGGVPLAEGRIVARVGRGAYSARSEVRTSDLVNTMITATVSSRIQGERDRRGAADALSPGVFQLDSLVQDKTFAMRMDFENDAPRKIVARPKYKKKSYEIDPREQFGALDPMSALLMAFLPPASGDVCRREAPIFDGRRRFDVRLTGETRRFTAEGARYVECKGLVVRVAGFSEKMMRETEFPFDIRFRIDEDDHPIATQIWGRTDYGLGMATLRQ